MASKTCHIACTKFHWNFLHLRFDKTLEASRSEDQPAPCVDSNRTCHEASCVPAFAIFTIAFEQRMGRLVNQTGPSLPFADVLSLVIEKERFQIEWVRKHRMCICGSHEKLLQTLNATFTFSAKYGYPVHCGVECMVILHRKRFAYLGVSLKIFEIFCPLQCTLLSQFCSALSMSFCKSSTTQYLKKCYRKVEIKRKYEARTLFGDVHVFRSRKTLQ